MRLNSKGNVFERLSIHGAGSTDTALEACMERSIEDLLGNRSLLRLEVVLSDEPASHAFRLRADNYLLGECGITHTL